MCLCARRFSQHVCTRLLTYTVYSWLGSEPGALKIVQRHPAISSPRPLGVTLYVQDQEWEICCFLQRRFARLSLFLVTLKKKFFNSTIHFSNPLSFLTPRSSFLLSCFFAFGDADTHRAKEWEKERGSKCCDRSAVRSADSCSPFDLSANLLPLTVELHDVLQLHAC